MSSWNHFSASPGVTYATQQQARNVQQTITECTIGCLHVIKCADFKGPVSMINVSIENLSVQNGSFGSLTVDNLSIENLSVQNGSFGSLTVDNLSTNNLNVTNFYNEALSNMSYLHWYTIQNLTLSSSPLIPHVGFYSTTAQSISIDNNPGTVTFNTVGISNNAFVQLSGTKIYSQINGTLNVDFTYQFYNQGGGGSGDLVTVWVVKNGTNIPRSGNSIHVPTNGRDVSYSGGLYVPVSIGDFIELQWTTDNHQAIYAHYVSGTSVYPDTPSVKCEIHLLKNQ